MLLINDIIDVDRNSSSSLIYVDSEAPFFEKNKGIPSYIGLEYMGQTAALIAGYQLKHGLVEPHLGFLLGTRAFNSELEYFAENKVLVVECKEKALVGDSLATFDCCISYQNDESILATANLSVFRKAKNSK
jgi:predicted hotdog family 3-hydroxylacyl-ACP dehydratase